ncbi:MAG: 5-methyltetrahydropteroyltriglutamate--homocysteine methyltransferase [Gammaproteobacteria bacterium]|jgi:5-methyltetrahydropteroyltriglutamate--homocysteine methyltransferase
MLKIKTTCIGAYPKPEYVPIIDWFDRSEGEQDMTTTRATLSYEQRLDEAGEAAEALFVRAATEVIADQIECGIDIPTDGEVRRENYIHYHCRHFDGIEFDNLTRVLARDGAAYMELPTISSAIVTQPGHFLPHDFKAAQASTKQPIKITVPGPITIADTTADRHYGDKKKLCHDLAIAINHEVRALSEAGCRYIQIDEPLFARNPDEALAFGIENLERCFHGIGKHTTAVMHMCCGYPNFLDEDGYQKAQRQTYFDLADNLDDSIIQQISIEDAHQHNDLKLLERFARSTIIFGSFAVASSSVESTEQIRDRLRAALNHIDIERLIAAPDCGLGLLGRDLAMKKLKNMCEAAKNL